MCIPPPFAAIVAGVLLLAPQASAADRFVPYWRTFGILLGDGFFHGLGDVNADGFDDLFFLKQTGNCLPPMQALARGGNDGQILYSWPAPAGTPCSVGGVGPIGDLDLDGHAEIGLVGAAGFLEVRSGATGGVYGIAPPLVYPLSTGIVLAAPLGDVDGDGFAEFIATTNGYQSSTAVAVYSGASLQPIYAYNSLLYATYLGSSIGGMEDVDGDGIQDFWIGEFSAVNPGGGAAGGRLYLHSGATGGLLSSIQGTLGPPVVGGYGFPDGVLTLGDVDGDGFPELGVVVVSSPAAGVPGQYYLHVYSAPSFTLLWSLPMGPAALSIYGLGDCDGDGTGDILARRPTALAAHSGATGALLWQVSLPLGYHPWPDAVGDVNGDGLGDFATIYAQNYAPAPPGLAAQSLVWGYDWPSTGHQSWVYVARNLDLAVSPTVGGIASFEVLAPKHPGKAFQIVLAREGAFPGLPLGPFLLPVFPDDVFLASFAAGLAGTLDASGKGTLSLPIPADPALHGRSLVATGWVIDPSASPLPIGCVLTGLHFTIQ